MFHGPSESTRTAGVTRLCCYLLQYYHVLADITVTHAEFPGSFVLQEVRCKQL